MPIEGTVPVPASCTVWGLFAELPAIVSMAVRAPAADGLKLRLALHGLPFFTVAHCPGATLKSPAFVPLMTRLEISRSSLPVSEMASGNVSLVPVATSPKSRLLATLIVGGVYAVPLRGIELLFAVPGVVTVRVPVWGPAVTGLKVIGIPHA